MPEPVPSPTAHRTRVIRRYFDVLRRWIWLLALCALLGGVGAFMASQLMPPIYRATALLVVGPQTTGSDPYNGLLASDQLVTTYLGLITQPVVLQRAAAQVPGVSAQQLARRVSVTDQAGTQIIELDVDDTSSVRAARLANAIASAFIGMQHESSSATLARAQQQVNEQLTQVSAQITQLTANINSLRIKAPTSSQAQILQQGLSAALARQDALQTVSAQLTTQQIMATNSVSVFQPATPPPAPDHPKPVLNAAIGGVLGLVVAAALVWLLEYLDDRIRTPERAVERLGLPMLTTMDTYRGHAPLLDRPGNGKLARDIGVLLANLDPGDFPRTVAVTSAAPSEGRTTVATNLSIALARAGRRVLLVDGDLHQSRPRAKSSGEGAVKRRGATAHAGVHDLLSIPKSVGLSSVVTGTGKSHDALSPSSVPNIPNLYVLPAGLAVADPSDVFQSNHVRHYLEWVAGDPSDARVDAVVIDTPPATAYADAALLARWVDATILVVDARCSRAEAVLHTKQMLLQAHARLAGVVLNRVSARESTADLAEYSSPRGAEELVSAHVQGVEGEEQHGPMDVQASQPRETSNGLWGDLSDAKTDAPAPPERWTPTDRPDAYAGEDV